MYISKDKSIREDWDKVKSWNYKLPHLSPQKSVVYAEIQGEHGEVTTKESEWIYYIIEGKGKFIINNETVEVSGGDVITVPANTPYNYFANEETILKVVMFIDMWENQ